MQITHVIKFAFSTKMYILLMLLRVKAKLHSSGSYQVMFTGFTCSLQMSLSKNKAISAGI